VAVQRGHHPPLCRVYLCGRQDERRRKLATVTSKRISADMRAVAQGTFNFSLLEPLMAVSDQEEGEDEA
jgi:hypothetical protein